MKLPVRLLSKVTSWLCAPLTLPPDVGDHFLTIDAAQGCLSENCVSVDIWYGNRRLARVTNGWARAGRRKFALFALLVRYGRISRGRAQMRGRFKLTAERQ
jgi:hypothetical protein